MNVYFWTAVAASAAVGAVARAAGFRWVASAGIGLAAWPFARLAVNVGASLGSLFEFTVLATVSEAALWRSAGRSLWHSFAVPFAGLALATGGVVAAARFARLTTVAGPRRDLANGFALVPFAAAAYLVSLAILLSGAAGGLQDGDESAVFLAVTPLLAFVLSVAAAITEEFLYRGLLLASLARFVPLPAAVLLQALLFGFAHSGYGTWTHVLAPAVFGLALAWITLRLGLAPAMVLHAAVNVVFFAFDRLAWDPVGASVLLAAIAAPSAVGVALVRFAPARVLLEDLARWVGWRRPARNVR